MIDPYEILGRERLPILPDSQYLKGRRVLVTGAGGSIGSELCQRLATVGVEELTMVDRDESALHAVSLAIFGQALLSGDRIALADITDIRAIMDVFQRARPEVVFHAAAVKHQPLLEQYPREAVKVNIMGTCNVLRAALNVGVQVLVNVSTDKAADPSCVLGTSKRAAERIVAGWATYSCGRFSSVRFGNVFASRGSVVETFLWQMRNDEWVTVTSPGMTRYFVTKDEAVDLLIHAGSMNVAGDVLIMDMGKPMPIVDLAQALADKLGVSSNVVYAGIREGEKIEEILQGRDELMEPTAHRLISRIKVPPMTVDTIPVIDLDYDDPEAIRRKLHTMVIGEQ